VLPCRPAASLSVLSVQYCDFNLILSALFTCQPLSRLKCTVKFSLSFSFSILFNVSVEYLRVSMIFFQSFLFGILFRVFPRPRTQRNDRRTKTLARKKKLVKSDDVVQFGPKSATNNKRSIQLKKFPKQNWNESEPAVLFRGNTYGGVHLFCVAIRQELRELY
jgi:hypothetical protein